MAPGGARKNGVGGKLRFHAARGANRAQPGARRGLDGLAQHQARFFQELLAAQARFGNDIHGAVFQRLQRSLRAFLGQTGTNDHRDGMLAHDLLQEGEPIHARHLDIQGDDVRRSGLYSFGGHERIGSSADHFDVRVRRQDIAERLPDHGGIVHDQNADPFLLHAAPLPGPSLYTRTSPVPVWK